MIDLELKDAPTHTSAACDEAEGVADDSVSRLSQTLLGGVRTGVLVGFRDNGRTPLVVLSGQRGGAAVPSRTTLDLHGAHVGREVALMFENGDSRHPIIMGCLSRGPGWSTEERPVQVELDADGERLQVTAKYQLVLQCGKASITLTSAGKVLIQGAYVSIRSSGVNRIKGGSVQIN